MQDIVTEIDGKEVRIVTNSNLHIENILVDGKQDGKFYLEHEAKIAEIIEDESREAGCSQKWWQTDPYYN
jgi:hypothetical protein